MRMKYNFIYFIFLINAIYSVGILPAAGILSAIAGPYLLNKYRDSFCYIGECCKDALNFDEEELRENLESHIFGQNFALERVLSLIKSHLKNPNPLKPLVLSFHGSTGVGKTFMATQIVDSIYRYGKKSKYYHFFDSSRDFIHASKSNEYKDKIIEAVTHASTRCERNFFIFDEIHKMPPNVLDALTPFLGYRDEIDGYDFRKNIFIFLSNTGGASINNFIYNAHMDGIKRYDIDYQFLSKKITSEAFLTDGGLKMSELINQHFISDVIIFLPLDVAHVEKCIRIAAKQRNVTINSKIVESVKSELLWFPEDSQLFCQSGCKLISDKIGLYLD